MNASKKMIISLLFASLACSSFSRASDAEKMIYGFAGAAITLIGVWIKSLFDKKPLDLKGSIYRENMRPKKGEEFRCRELVRFLEILDHSLTLDDKQGQSVTKLELGKQQISFLNEYNLKCNETTANSKLF